MAKSMGLKGSARKEQDCGIIDFSYNANTWQVSNRGCVLGLARECFRQYLTWSRPSGKILLLDIDIDILCQEQKKYIQKRFAMSGTSSPSPVPAPQHLVPLLFWIFGPGFRMRSPPLKETFIQNVLALPQNTNPSWFVLCCLNQRKTLLA